MYGSRWLSRTALLMVLALAGGLAFEISAGAPALAGNPYTFIAEWESAQGLKDQTAGMTILFDYPDGEALNGYSIALCDDSKVTIGTGDVVNGSTVAEHAYTFHAVGFPTGGWYIGAALSFSPVDTIPAGADLEMYLATYDLVSLGVSVVDFCTLGSPPNANQVIEATVDGESFVPGFVEGSIEIIDAPPMILAAEDAVLTVNQAGDTLSDAAVHVTFSTQDDNIQVGAFSFGLLHDAGKLTLEDIHLVGSVTAALNNNAGPDFFHPNMTPSGGSGGTVGVVTSLETPFDTIDAGDDQVLVTFVYSAGSTASAGDNVALSFTDTLGAPPVALIIASGPDRLVPFTAGGTVSIEEVLVASHSFLRADVKNDGIVNIVDAISLLGYLFPCTTCTFVPDCLETVDVNGDHNQNIVDALRLLNFLFQSGTPPASPYPSCGSATEDLCAADTASCD